MQRGSLPNVTSKYSSMSPENSLILRLKGHASNQGSESHKKNIAGVGLCTLMIAGILLPPAPHRSCPSHTFPTIHKSFKMACVVYHEAVLPCARQSPLLAVDTSLYHLLTYCTGALQLSGSRHVQQSVNG